MIPTIHMLFCCHPEDFYLLWMLLWTFLWQSPRATSSGPSDLSLLLPCPSLTSTRQSNGTRNKVEDLASSSHPWMKHLDTGEWFVAGHVSADPSWFSETLWSAFSICCSAALDIGRNVATILLVALELGNVVLQVKCCLPCRRSLPEFWSLPSHRIPKAFFPVISAASCHNARDPRRCLLSWSPSMSTRLAASPLSSGAWFPSRICGSGLVAVELNEDGEFGACGRWSGQSCFKCASVSPVAGAVCPLADIWFGWSISVKFVQLLRATVAPIWGILVMSLTEAIALNVICQPSRVKIQSGRNRGGFVPAFLADHF